MLLGTNTIELLEVSNNCLAHLSPFHVAQVQLLRVVALPPEGVVMPDRELHLVPRSTNVLVFAKLNTIGVELAGAMEILYSAPGKLWLYSPMSRFNVRMSRLRSLYGQELWRG